MTYLPHPGRYQQMEYRRSGRSGLKLPAISLGLWHNFGDNTRVDNSRELLRHAFDRGITHFDMARRRARRKRTLAAFCAKISARFAMSW